jgi:predicted RNA-binding Zn-ribbon protein involved in translation (DUF1610 family)
MEKCPDCGSEFTRRIPRAWWMRLLFPNSIRIHCSQCGETSLLRRAGAGTKY